MVTRIEALLADAKNGPLSFLVVVPDWGGAASAARACRASPRARAEATIGAADHVFADGAQHRVADRYRPSSWDTAVVLLQNDRGAAKWPLDSATLAATLKRSFSRAANDPAAPRAPGREDLQAWERRGPAKGGKRSPAPPPKQAQPRKKKPRQKKPRVGADEPFFLPAD